MKIESSKDQNYKIRSLVFNKKQKTKKLFKIISLYLLAAT